MREEVELQVDNIIRDCIYWVLYLSHVHREFSHSFLYYICNVAPFETAKALTVGLWQIQLSISTVFQVTRIDPSKIEAEKRPKPPLKFPIGLDSLSIPFAAPCYSCNIKANLTVLCFLFLFRSYRPRSIYVWQWCHSRDSLYASKPLKDQQTPTGPFVAMIVFTIRC